MSGTFAILCGAVIGLSLAMLSAFPPEWTIRRKQKPLTAEQWHLVLSDEGIDRAVAFFTALHDYLNRTDKDTETE